MRKLRQSLIATSILISLAGMLSIGCGLFVLPVAGPKALATNAQRLHFTLDIIDADGNPLPDVTLESRLISADANLVWGEVEKDESETKTVSGHYEYDGFGKFAVRVTISKPGYTTVALLCSNSDKLERLGAPGLVVRPPAERDREARQINVQRTPEQHVILSPLPARTPADQSRPQ